MWVRFTSRFSFHATAATTIVYKPDGGPHKDGRYNVTRDCAALAIEAGAAQKSNAQSKTEDDTDGLTKGSGEASQPARVPAPR